MIHEACAGIIDPEVFRSSFTPENLADIEAGRIPIQSLRAYAESLAERIASGRIKLLSSADDRRRCRTCRNFRGERDPQTGYCSAYNAHIVDRPPRRCIEYQPRPDDSDQRSGRQRWPRLGEVS